MPDFSQKSLDILATCEEPLQMLMKAVVRRFDCTILDGSRTEEEQRQNVAKGVSKTMASKHLVSLDHPLSRAVDAAPWPLRWPKPTGPDVKKELAVYYYFGGYVLGTADMLGIKIVWGGDWDSDRDIHEQDFDDLVHFELV